MSLPLGLRTLITSRRNSSAIITALSMIFVITSAPNALAAGLRLGGGGSYGSGGSYYQPRVYNSPPPAYSRDAYQLGYGTAGGLIGGRYGGGYGATVGGGLGQYYGGRAYDYQSQYNTQRYYYPPAYGTQTTTPYMLRTVPRY